mgnify:CR=1 FL=1
MLQTDMLCGDIHTPHSIFLPLAEGANRGAAAPPRVPDAREAKAQEAADMKKKVTDLSQALAVGLPVPASAAGRPFPTSPPRPGPSPQLRSGRTGGRLLRPIRISFHPLKVRIHQIAPRHSVPPRTVRRGHQVRPWASAMALNFPAPPSCSNCVSKSRLRACLITIRHRRNSRQDWCSHLRKNCPRLLRNRDRLFSVLTA